MGNTLWRIKKGQNATDSDHSLILNENKNLDILANSIGVKKLSEFFDFSVLAEEFDAPAECNYIDPQEGIDTFSALINTIQKNKEEIKLNRENYE